MGGIIKKVGGFIGKVVQNPIFQMGLSMVTGGAGGLLAKGLGALAGAGGAGGIGGIFGNLAKSFLPNLGSMASQGGGNILGNFLQSAVGGGQGSGGIADILGRLAQNFLGNQNQQVDQQAAQAGLQNTQQMAAYYNAQAIQQQIQAQRASQYA